MYGATVWITISNTGFTCLTWILSCMKQNDWKLNPQWQQQTSSLVRDRARGWRGLIFLYFGVCDIKTFRDPCPASSITEDVQQHDCFNLVRDTKEKSFFVFFFYLMEVCWLRLCTQTEQGPILTSGVYTSELSNPGSNCMFVKNKGICSLYISARSSWVFFFLKLESTVERIWPQEKLLQIPLCFTGKKKQKKTYSVISGHWCLREHHKYTVKALYSTHTTSQLQQTSITADRHVSQSDE